MAQQSPVSVLQRIEGLPIIVVFASMLALFMYTAPTVFLQPFIYTTFLSTLPPVILLAIGLTWWIPGMLLAIGYSVFVYRHFAGRVKSGEAGYGHSGEAPS